MNKSPLNYLLTVGIGVVLWVVIAVFYGGTFSESLIYKAATPEQFLASLRIILAIGIAASILNCLYWYSYGSKESAAGDLAKAKRIWRSSFILQIILSVALLFALVMMYLSEGIATSSWLILFALISLLTWFFYWLCTFLMSPRNVQYVPLFK